MSPTAEAPTTDGAALLRAVGLARVSQDGGNEDKRTYTDQQVKMAALCKRERWSFRELTPERSVSGGYRLEDRPSLLQAVELIEAGRADVLVVAYKDRLDREPAVRDQVIDRVERAGGMVWTGDHGQDTNATATAQFTGTMLSAAGRMIRRQAKERSWDNVEASIADGICPYTTIPLGLRKRADGRLEVVEAEVPIVVGAFELRRDGATIDEIREYLRGHGVSRSLNGVTSLLASPLYLGEIRFGGHTPNLEAHPAIVDADLWAAVQKIRKPRGRKGKSDRLLARLGVLRCGTCGARLTVGLSRGEYPMYKCPSTPSDCAAKVTIGAVIVEEQVRAEAIARSADVHGRDSAREQYEVARADLERAQATLGRVIRNLALVEDEGEAQQMIAAAKRERDDAQAALDAVEPMAQDEVVSAEDCETLADWRRLIRAVCPLVTVESGGRGAERIRIPPLAPLG